MEALEATEALNDVLEAEEYQLPVQKEIKIGFDKVYGLSPQQKDKIRQVIP